MYRLFSEIAHRYDLHTPPEHYRHDHAFVLQEAAALGSPCRLLDVGCGTGVLVEKALQVGMLARGIDASPAMIRVAETRVGKDAVAVRRMQEIDEEGAYDLVVSLSWTLNYCEGRAELVDVLRRMRRALRMGGRVLLQVAHAANVAGEEMEDREPGPGGQAEDVVFRYRFVRLEGEEMPMRAEYVYACRSHNEVVEEKHTLRMADAGEVAQCARAVGFDGVEVYDSWRGDPLRGSASPFVSAVKGVATP
jgi:SAM-dependent methyltransferase